MGYCVGVGSNQREQENENMRKNITQTKNRVYWTDETKAGFFSARYQPINPKTGKVWQAWRAITPDGYILVDKSGNATPFIAGKCPNSVDELNAVAGFVVHWAFSGFESEQSALAAIEAEKAKNGKR